MLNIPGTNVTIMIKDRDSSIKFYESLGLKHWESHYAIVTANGVAPCIHPADENSALPSGSVSIGFMIEKIKDAIVLPDDNSIGYKEKMENRDAILHFKDPDGTALYF